MHKRILCLVLAVLLLLSLIPIFALPSQAASHMKTSEACIAILKSMEGFLEYPVWDYSHYSVGYGSTCEEGEYADGITEEEADALLREFLVDMEDSLNGLANRNGIIFSQYQFDALLLFTYNVGIGWIYNDGLFRQAVIDNATGNDFIYPLTLWSSAGGQTLTGLVTRRLIEADMYLNGSYSNTRPASYTYAFYDNNGGEGQAKVHGYDSNLTAYVQSVPTWEGYVFLGWYTAAQGGAWVTELTAAHSEKTLYAHWQTAGASHSGAVAASYELPAGKLASLDIFDVPGGNAAGTLGQDATALVVADYVDASGIKWGRLSSGHWVKLGDPRIGTGNENVVTNGVKVTITGDYLNVRTGPGTTYPVVAGVVQGNTVFLTRVVSVEGVLWGQFRAGWICLEYTDYSGGLPTEEPGSDIPQIPGTPTVPENPQKPEDKVIATGTVTANRLYIRASAGSRGEPVGSYVQGDRVEILEQTSIGGTPWGRTDKGWICLNYVKLDGQEEETETTEPTEPETTEPTVPETTEPEVPETTPPQEPEDTTGARAQVISKTALNIRSGPGNSYSVVGFYRPGQTIRIKEQTTVNGIGWGRTNQGWICMHYVNMQETPDNDNGVYGVVDCTGTLNIRSGPGVGYAPVGSYVPGTRILVYEQVTAGGRKWGRTDLGWVCMEYVRLEGADEEAPEETRPEEPETAEPEPTVPETEPEVPEAAITGKVTATGLNIRRIPGTNGPIMGSYRRGAQVAILETRQLNGTIWGRTDKGWISMTYVLLDEPKDDAMATKGVITADFLYIRMGPGTANVVVGTYKKGDTVMILEKTRVGVTLWGRTDKGWISMNYVKQE